MILSKQIKKILAASAAALMVGVASAASAEVVVVVSAKSQLNSLSREQIADIFLGRINRLPSGEGIVPIDQKEGDSLRDEFYLKLVDKSPPQMKAHWSKIIFTGRGRPPKELGNSQVVKRTIASNTEAIGYLEAEEIDSSVKAILIVH